MALKFKGKVWVFGDNLDVDKEIIPFREREMGLMKDSNFGKWVMTQMRNASNRPDRTAML